jgi:anti-sigma-K factor RskA
MHISQEIHELLAGFVMGDVSPEELEQVNQLLADHPELQEEIDQLQFTLSLLPLALPETSPSPALKEKILQSATPPEPQSVKPWGWFWSMGVIMAVLATGWALDSSHLRSRLAVLEGQISIASSQVENKLFMLESMDKSDKAWGVMTLQPQRQMAMVEIRNLSATPVNQTYRLWVIDMNNQMIDCGPLRPDVTGRISKELPLSQTLIKGASVTLEPMSPAPRPQGKTVMTSRS